MGKLTKYLASAAAVAAVPAICVVATAGVASAGTGTACSGTGCSGLDPTQSYSSANGAECSSGATAPLSESALGGTLQLRWGPNCQTNWARFTPGDNDKYQIWVTNLTTGVWAGTGLYNTYVFSNANGVAHYSDQVYTGPAPASVCVDDLTAGARACLSQ